MSYFIPTPMKYKEARTPEERMAILSDPNYCLTLKRDGASYMLSKDENGEVHFYSGGISKKDNQPIDKIENVPHLKKLAENYFPNNSMVIGEVCNRYDFTIGQWCDHSASKRVSSIMGCKPNLALKRQEQIGPVEYYLFDVLFWDDEDWYKKDFIDRHQKLQKIYVTMASNEDYPSWLSYDPIYIDNKEEILTDWFSAGEEGAVCMRLHSDSKKGADYVMREIGSPALRRDNGVKIKTMSTYDVIITEVLMPTKTYNGKYADSYEYRDEEGNPVNRLWALGYANAFEIGYYNPGVTNPTEDTFHVIGTVASGLTDEIRKDAAENPDKYIGKVIEVRCMSADKENETLRHPVFINFRDDKCENECTKETIF